ncbi:hypothetical protein NDU88_003007 [Pleurodeles waltl]|uniref:Uncharacterized protein n=1 Tax=Pleurodeles waltl TaxID=8319 RepID=A0AAV7UCV6_PLEWA|nr:hypothetical protein NDU88_003007 [Pleurodeles waltl]
MHFGSVAGKAMYFPHLRIKILPRCISGYEAVTRRNLSSKIMRVLGFCKACMRVKPAQDAACAHYCPCRRLASFLSPSLLPACVCSKDADLALGVRLIYCIPLKIKHMCECQRISAVGDGEENLSFDKEGECDSGFHQSVPQGKKL